MMEDFTYGTAHFIDSMLRDLYEKVQEKKLFSTPINEGNILHFIRSRLDG